MRDYDIIIRNCGSVGWLGILQVKDEEKYRTGKHLVTPEEALAKVLNLTEGALYDYDHSRH